MISSNNKSSLSAAIIKIVKKNKIIFKICRKVLNLSKRLIYRVVFVNFKTKDNIVIFNSHLGKNYSCNPRAIYEEIIKQDRFRDFKFIWAFRDLNKNSVQGAINVKYGSFTYLYYLSIAKYWIFNAKMPKYYIKKKDQKYLQTWHGTPLKKLGLDIDVGEDAKFYRSEISKKEMDKTYQIDSARYDYFISANRFSTKAFKSAFDLKENIIIETGYPRNDILANASEKYIDDIKKRLGIPEGKTIILYAPTWRDNKYDTKGYLHELKVDFNKWHSTLGDKYFIIYKPHYLIYNTSNFQADPSFVFDAKNCDEINDLYLISDILITDYSSVFFDYGVLKRPILFYMYDLDEYRDNLRGFYLDIYKDLPGPIIENEEELLNNILHIDKVTEKFAIRNEVFNKEFCYFNDGNSAKRVIDILFES